MINKRTWTPREAQAYRDYILEQDLRIRTLRERHQHVIPTP